MQGPSYDISTEIQRAVRDYVAAHPDADGWDDARYLGWLSSLCNELDTTYFSGTRLMILLQALPEKVKKVTSNPDERAGETVVRVSQKLKKLIKTLADYSSLTSASTDETSHTQTPVPFEEPHIESQCTDSVHAPEEALIAEENQSEADGAIAILRSSEGKEDSSKPLSAAAMRGLCGAFATGHLHIEKLDLSRQSNLGPYLPDLCRALKDYPYLKQLILPRESLSHVDFTSLTRLLRCNSYLTDVEFKGAVNSIYKIQLKTIVQAADENKSFNQFLNQLNGGKLVGPKHLDLSGKLKPRFWKYINEIADKIDSLTHLEEIDLSRNGLNYQTLAALLNKIVVHGKIKALDLSFNQLKSDSLVTLGGIIGSNPSLSTLNLSRNPLEAPTDSSASTSQSLDVMLKHIYGDDEIHPPILPHTGLEAIDLSHTDCYLEDKHFSSRKPAFTDYFKRHNKSVKIDVRFCNTKKKRITGGIMHSEGSVHDYFVDYKKHFILGTDGFTESVFEPHLLVDREHSVIAITRRRDSQHVHVNIERLLPNGQLQLIDHEILRNDNRGGIFSFLLATKAKFEDKEVSRAQLKYRLRNPLTMLGVTPFEWVAIPVSHADGLRFEDKILKIKADGRGYRTSSFWSTKEKGNCLTIFLSLLKNMKILRSLPVKLEKIGITSLITNIKADIHFEVPDHARLDKPGTLAALSSNGIDTRPYAAQQDIKADMTRYDDALTLLSNENRFAKQSTDEDVLAYIKEKPLTIRQINLGLLKERDHLPRLLNQLRACTHLTTVQLDNVASLANTHIAALAEFLGGYPYVSIVRYAEALTDHPTIERIVQLNRSMLTSINHLFTTHGLSVPTVNCATGSPVLQFALPDWAALQSDTLQPLELKASLVESVLCSLIELAVYHRPRIGESWTMGSTVEAVVAQLEKAGQLHSGFADRVCSSMTELDDVVVDEKSIADVLQRVTWSVVIPLKRFAKAMLAGQVDDSNDPVFNISAQHALHGTKLPHPQIDTIKYLLSVPNVNMSAVEATIKSILRDYFQRTAGTKNTLPLSIELTDIRQCYLALPNKIGRQAFIMACMSAYPRNTGAITPREIAWSTLMSICKASGNAFSWVACQRTRIQRIEKGDFNQKHRKILQSWIKEILRVASLQAPGYITLSPAKCIKALTKAGLLSVPVAQALTLAWQLANTAPPKYLPGEATVTLAMQKEVLLRDVLKPLQAHLETWLTQQNSVWWDTSNAGRDLSTINTYLELPTPRPPLLDYLAQLPNPAGTCIFAEESAQAWQQQLLEIITEPMPRDAKGLKQRAKAGRVEVAWAHQGKLYRRLLKKSTHAQSATHKTPTIHAQLLDAAGKMDSTKPGAVDAGRRTVIAVRDQQDRVIAYAKAYPELPGIQWAVDALLRRLTGFGCMSTVCHFIPLGAPETSYSVLLSQTAGKSLHQCLKDGQPLSQLEPELDDYFLGLKALATYVVGLEDDKKDNVTAQTYRYSDGSTVKRLVSIDTDHAYADEMTEEGDKVEIKSVTYCFNGMQRPLAAWARQRWKCLDPNDVLTSWLAGCAQWDRFLETDQAKKQVNELLFPKKVQQRLASPKQRRFLSKVFSGETTKEFSYVRCVFEREALAMLYQRLWEVERLLGQSHHIVSLAADLQILTQRMMPYYRKMLCRNREPSERFDEFSALYTDYQDATCAKPDAAGRETAQGTETNTQDTVSAAEIGDSPKPISIRVQKSRRQPVAVLQRLLAVKPVKRRQTLLKPQGLREAIASGRSVGVEKAWQAFVSVHKYYSDIDELVKGVQAGKVILWGYRSDFLKDEVARRLDWGELSPERQQAFLRSLVGTHFQHLDLSGCTSLTDDLLAQLVVHPGLYSLTLSGCEYLTDEGFAAVVGYQEKTLVELRLENIPFTRIGSVERTHIIEGRIYNSQEVKTHHLIQLRRLLISRCASLKTIDVISAGLEGLTVQDCSQLTTVNANWQKLDQLTLTDCPLLHKQTIFQALVKYWPVLGRTSEKHLATLAKLSDGECHRLSHLSVEQLRTVGRHLPANLKRLVLPVGEDNADHHKRLALLNIAPPGATLMMPSQTQPLGEDESEFDDEWEMISLALARATLPDGRVVDITSDNVRTKTDGKKWRLQKVHQKLPDFLTVKFKSYYSLLRQDVKSVVVLPDGRVVGGLSRGSLLVWTELNGQWSRVQFDTRLGGLFRNAVCALIALPDGHVVCGAADGTLRVWSEHLHCQQVLTGHTGVFYRSINALIALPDGRVVSGADDMTLRVWVESEGRWTCQQVLEGHTDSVTGLTVLPDGRMVSGSRDKTLRVWAERDGQWHCQQVHNTMLRWNYPLQTLSLDFQDALAGRVAVNCEKKAQHMRITVSSADAQADDINLALKSCADVLEQLFPGLAINVTTAIEIISNDQFDIKFIIQLSHLLRRWCMTHYGILEGLFNILLNLSQKNTGSINIKGCANFDSDSAIEVLVDGRLALTENSSGVVLQIWAETDRQGWSCQNALKATPRHAFIRTLATLPDGRVVSGAFDNRLRIYAERDGEWCCQQVLSGHRKRVNIATVLPDGCVVSGSDDGTLRVWGENTGQWVCHQVLKGHAKGVLALAVLPNGSVVGSYDRNLRVWSKSNGQWSCKAMIKALGWVYAILTLPDGRIISGAESGWLQVWVKQVWIRGDGYWGYTQMFKGHIGQVTVLTLLLDGRILSGSSDGSLKIWAERDGVWTCQQTLEKDIGSIRALITLPDGRIVCGSENRPIRAWSLPMTQLLYRAWLTNHLNIESQFPKLHVSFVGKPTAMSLTRWALIACHTFIRQIINLSSSDYDYAINPAWTKLTLTFRTHKNHLMAYQLLLLGICAPQQLMCFYKHRGDKVRSSRCQRLLAECQALICALPSNEEKKEACQSLLNKTQLQANRFVELSDLLPPIEFALTLMHRMLTKLVNPSSLSSSEDDLPALISDDEADRQQSICLEQSYELPPLEGDDALDTLVVSAFLGSGYAALSMKERIAAFKSSAHDIIEMYNDDFTMSCVTDQQIHIELPALDDPRYGAPIFGSKELLQETLEEFKNYLVTALGNQGLFYEVTGNRLVITAVSPEKAQAVENFLRAAHCWFEHEEMRREEAHARTVI